MRSGDKMSGKKLSLRAILFLIVAIIYILLDEYIKEGYLVKPSDFLKPATHENILTIILISGLVVIIYLRKKNR